MNGAATMEGRIECLNGIYSGCTEGTALKYNIWTPSTLHCAEYSSPSIYEVHQSHLIRKQTVTPCRQSRTRCVEDTLSTIDVYPRCDE